MDIWSFLSFILTVAGFFIVVWQLLRTKHSIEAASEAMHATRKAIQNNISIADITKLVKTTQQINQYICAGQFEVALHHIEDLKSSLDTMLGITNMSDPMHRSLSIRIKKLAQIESDVYQELHNVGQNKFDIKDAHESMIDIAGLLNSKIGTLIYNIRGDN